MSDMQFPLLSPLVRGEAGHICKFTFMERVCSFPGQKLSKSTGGKESFILTEGLATLRGRGSIGVRSEDFPESQRRGRISTVQEDGG